MTSGLSLRGVYVPLVTPFESDGSVAMDALEGLARRALDAGVAGLVPLGTTGEAATLAPEERRDVVEVCARVCVERGAALIVGAGTNDTVASISAVQALAEVPGLTAILVVVPYYLRPSEAGIVAHFKAVAAASPAPVVVYNVPARTGRSLGAGSLLELAHTPNIAGVKQAVGSLDVDTLEVLARKPVGFALLGGDDAFLYPSVLMGGEGAVCASANVCTDRFVAMIECGLAGKLEDGRGHAEALLPVVRAGFAEPNPVVFKGVLHALGRIPTPRVRLPLVEASPGAVERALLAVRAASA